MINKIGNWVFGSFFRTIGRLLVFVLLGVIIASVVDFGDIFDNFRITDLFFERVDALSLDGSYGGLIQVNDNDQSLSLYKNQYSDGISFKYPYTANQGYEYLVFGYSGVFGVEQTNDPDTITYNYFVERFGLTLTLTASNGGGYNTACEIQNNMLVCPIKPNGIYNGIYATLYNGASFTDSSPEIRISITAYPTLYNVDGTQEIINNQNQNTQQQMQQQQQQHNEMMDSNTTEAEDEAGDFLGNFTIEDTGGLNAIITAPLATIQSLLNNTCNKLVLPLPFVSKNIELPCLYPIYNDYFGAFFTIYQTIILGIISYRCIKSLFFDVKGFTNPEDDRIEVMDL